MNKPKPLTPQEALNQFRHHRYAKTLQRGTVKKETLKSRSDSAQLAIEVTAIVLLGGILLTLLFRFLILPFAWQQISHPLPIPLVVLPFTDDLFQASLNARLWAFAAAYGVQTSFLLAVAYIFWPAWHLLGYLLRHRKRPTQALLHRYSITHQIAAFFLLALLATAVIYPSNAQLIGQWLLPTHAGGHGYHHSPHDPFSHFLIAWGSLWIVFTLGIPLTLAKIEPAKRPINAAERDFSLYLGTSTGKLIKRHHVAAMAPHQRVCLTAQDAALNVLILGGIGEGKTTSVIHALLLQLLDQTCGGLIFDVKGNFHHAVTELAALTQTDIVRIGPGQQRINLLAQLKPEVAADILSAIFLMFNGNHQSSFWVTQAVNLCRGALGLLAYFPEHYTLEGLRRYIFDAAFRETLEAQLGSRPLTVRERALIQSYQASLAMFHDCPERMQGDIRATASSALSQFTHPDIQESFCSHTNDPLHLEDVLDGKIILVDMPKADYGQVSRTVQAVIKMRWFHLMEARRRHPEWNQDRIVFFLCDEYQDLITADATGGTISDLSFWDKARDTKAMGIISAQSIASFYSAIGNRDLADTVLQNFRQRLCFKTEDEKTIQHLQRLTGEVMVAHRSESRHEGTSRGEGKSQKSESTTESLSHTRQHVIDGQLMRVLDPNQVIALLNVGQRSMDDVLTLQPVFLTGELTEKEN